MHATITKAFFALTDTRTKRAVLTAIGQHYGISPAEAEQEVTDEGAESLLDYLTGSIRIATHALMQRHGLA